MSGIKVAMRISLYAGDVLVLDIENDHKLWGQVFNAVYETCPLCYQVPREHCCRNKAKDGAAG